MISYIVASHHWPTLRDNLAATVRGVAGDEVVVVENPASIAKAYNEGQARARNRVRCYVHHDVRILDPRQLRAALLDACRPDVGIVGLIGSRTDVVPWWDGHTLGSVVDARLGVLDFGPGGTSAHLDGLLLATAQHVDWDEAYPGFHGYDHDACRQMLTRGLHNHCLTGGRHLAFHNTAGPTDLREIDGWADAANRYAEKWSVPTATGGDAPCP